LARDLLSSASDRLGATDKGEGEVLMTLLRAALLGTVLLGAASAAQAGTFNGWELGGGWWYGGWPINPNDYFAGGSLYDISANASAIVTKYNDPNTGGALSSVYPGGGTYSARINDDNNNYSVSTIRQTVANYTDPHIYFAWAAVLEGSHGLTDSDNFTLKLTDDTTSTTLYNVSYSSASAAGTDAYVDVSGDHNI
jgi:hypothetical protein